MQSLPDEDPVTSEDILSAVEYADDIHLHLRDSEVSIYFKLYRHPLFLLTRFFFFPPSS